MNCNITRQEALALLRKYNKEPFHIQHALTVEGVMRYFAGETGNGEEAYWGIVGLLHDIDFELYPEQHCVKARELLRTTDKRSGEVAAAVGYRDPHYFSFLFKKTQGCTPRDYRGGGKRL